MRLHNCFRMMAASLLVAVGVHGSTIESLKSRAAEGDLKSETDLGDDYYKGTDVAADKEKAFSLLKAAAEGGYPRAEHDLGVIYLKGDGVPTNIQEALVWLHKSADQGFVDSWAHLGAIYENEAYGLKKDDKEACKWYEMAARGGNEESGMRLANYYANGIVRPKNIQKALAWALKSAMGGDAQASGIAACCYYNGDGLEVNYSLAWIWSELAIRGAKDNPDLKAHGDKDFLAGMKQVNDYSWSQLGEAERVDASRKANEFWASLQQGEPSLIPWMKDEMQVSYDTSQDQHPFEFSKNHIWLPVMIGRAGPFWFMLDAGSFTSTIDEMLAQHLALPVTGSYPGFGNDLNPRAIVESDYSVFGNKVQHGSFVSIPFTAVSRLAKRQVGGILGMDFIRNFIVSINYREQSIGLFSPDQYHYEGQGTVLPMVMSSGCPTISGQIMDKNGDPVEVQFCVDTGSDLATDLSLIQAKDLEIMPPLVKPGRPSGDIYGNPTSDTVGVLPLLEIGSLKIPQTTMTISDGEWYENPTIGNEIWKRFILTLDYSRKQIILEANEATNAGGMPTQR